jgi:hypothetical protein
MGPERIREILGEVAAGVRSVDNALEALRLLPFEELGFARLDHHRALRRGFPEVIFGPGKTAEQVRLIASRLARQNQNVLVTRTTEDVYRELAKELPDARWHGEARAIVVEREAWPRAHRPLVVASAGTSDIPVAEEAALTAELMGSPVDRVFDVGVAGIHRLTAERDRLLGAGAIVVVAGMEGALPSVVAGLVSVPVIAVPTSVGYGASFGGISALLAMLNTCAPGVAVVNIDNGFGAGYLAALVNRPESKKHGPRS